jgi:hypothetical protein
VSFLEDSLNGIANKRQLRHQKQFAAAERFKRANNINEHFSDEAHSLKGKSGKSHGIC